jgi:hypothetical protein
MSASTVNVPRFRVTMNGQVLVGVKAVQVRPPFGFRIGQFSFVKAFVSGDAFPVSWWAATASKTMLITIELSIDGVAFQQVILGNVDNHRYDPIGNSISVAGRDLAALMCDERIAGTYRNQTASQIASAFAAEHGLKIIAKPTTNLVGRYYEMDYDEIHGGNFSSAINEWDLLCRLGSEEGINPYVIGSTLYFNTPPLNPPAFPITCSRNAAGELVSNVTDLMLERHMTQARDVIVTVRSWNSRKKATLSATVRTKTKVPSSDPNVAPSDYLIVLPNLRQDQCLKKAQQLALDYSQHERNLSATYPSLGFMDPQTVIPLSGTGTDYDLTYYPQAVTYSVDFNGGARTEIFAKYSSALSLYDVDTGGQIGESQDF